MTNNQEEAVVGWVAPQLSSLHQIAFSVTTFARELEPRRFLSPWTIRD
jgi:hypothetical protein